jgi:hypothetical protein
MHTRWLALSLMVAIFTAGCSKKTQKSDAPPAASTTPAAAAPDKPATAAPKRSKVGCAELLTKMEETSKRMNLPVKAIPHSWGNIPPELRKLPAGAEHCGSVDALGQAIIVSPLFGKDLEAYYAPLFASVGCAPFTCEIVTSDPYVQTRCKCKQGKVMKGGMLGTVSTDTGAESYTIALMK